MVDEPKDSAPTGRRQQVCPLLIFSQWPLSLKGHATSTTHAALIPSHHLKKRGGFTLIELMLVVAIVALLAAIATPKFSNLVDKAREAGMKANLSLLRSGLSIYYADNEGLYPKYDSLTAVVNRGMVLLHPKYVDFDAITFVSPRYAGGQSRKAMEIYCCDVITIQSHNSRATVPPDNPPVHSVSIFPSYWNHLVNGIPARASIKTHAFNFATGSYYVDTKGQAWSLW